MMLQCIQGTVILMYYRALFVNKIRGYCIIFGWPNSLHSVTAFSFALLWEAGTPLRVKGFTHLFQNSDTLEGTSPPTDVFVFWEGEIREGGWYCMYAQPAYRYCTFPRREGGAMHHPPDSQSLRSQVQETNTRRTRPPPLTQSMALGRGN